MKDEQKGGEELVTKLAGLPQRVAELEASETRLRRVEEATRAALDRYESLAANISGAFYSSLPDEAGTITFMAGRWEDWTGYSPRDFYRNPETWAKFIHTDDLDRMDHAYIEACRTGQGWDIEYRVIHKDTGVVRWARDCATVISDEKGEIIRFDCIVTDVTDRKLSRDDLVRTMAKVDEARRAAERANDELAVEIGKRKRTARVLRRRVGELDAFRQASRALAESIELDFVLDTILAQAETIVGGDSYNIMLIDEGIARVVRGRGYENLSVPDPTSLVSLPIAESPHLLHMLETGEPVVAPNTTADPDWVLLEGRELWLSYVGAPIRAGEETVGFINVNGTQPRHYDAEDAARLQTLADCAATAVRNARLYGQVQRELGQRRRAEEELAHRVAELEQFNRLAVGRELRMIDLKRQLNELSRELGREPLYDVSFAGEAVQES